MDLQEISDRLEIEGVVIRYTRGIDTGAWDLLDTVFTPDAEIDYTESGGIAERYPAVKPWLAEVLPLFFPKRMHSLHQLDIGIEVDRLQLDIRLAEGRWRRGVDMLELLNPAISAIHHEAAVDPTAFGARRRTFRVLGLVGVLLGLTYLLLSHTPALDTPVLGPVQHHARATEPVDGAAVVHRDRQPAYGRAEQLACDACGHVGLEAGGDGVQAGPRGGRA